jgi:hypothetical protein
MMVGLVGKARSGKSSVAKIMVEEFDYSIFPMAGPIRSAIKAAFPFISPYDLGGGKEEIIPQIGKTGRHMLQQMGHNWGRETIDKDLWVKANEAHINISRVDFDKVVVDDVRYDNECEWIKSHGGYIIGVDRPGIKDGQASWRDHPSEGGISEHLIDEWIANISCLTLDLEYATLNVLTKLLGPTGLNIENPVFHNVIDGDDDE